jgi:hypothetical protein
MEFETASQTRKHQIAWPIGIRISPSLRGKATSFLTTRVFIRFQTIEISRDPIIADRRVGKIS